MLAVLTTKFVLIPNFKNNEKKKSEWTITTLSLSRFRGLGSRNRHEAVINSIIKHMECDYGSVLKQGAYIGLCAIIFAVWGCSPKSRKFLWVVPVTKPKLFSLKNFDGKS